MSFFSNIFKSSKKPKTKKRTSSLMVKITAAGDRMAFSWKIRESLYRHISSQVSNGVPVESALESFRERLIRNKKMSSDKIIVDIGRRMRDGATLAGAIGKWAPADEVNIVSSGELSGNLAKALDLIIEAKNRIARVNKALKSAMISPGIYLAAVYGMLWAIGHYVTPGLELALPKARATGMVYALYVGGDFLNTLWAILPPIIFIIIVFIVVKSLPKWTGPKRISAENYFPYSFYRDINGYTWLMGFTALLRAGMADVEIVKRQIEGTSPWLRERLYAIWWRMENGKSLPAALLEKGKKSSPSFGFPNPDIVDDISSLAGFPDFPEKIAMLATQWSESLESATLAKAKALGATMEMIMLAVIGVLMVAINSMSTQLGSIPGV